MFFSRQYDYALRVIRALADGNLLSVNELCVAEHVPQPFAYKILKKLENASLVVSTRGAKGGYQLTKPPQEISMYDVYLAVEGDIYINECMQTGYDCPHNHGQTTCAIHKELCKLQKEFVGKMKERDMQSILSKK